MKKKFKVEDKVFKTEVLFLCGYSHIEMANEMKNLGVKDFDVDFFKHADGSQMFFREDSGVNSPFRVVWLRYFTKSPYCIGTASHEIFHLVVRICDDKGIPIDRSNNSDETGAYLQDFYMRHFIGKLFNKEPHW